MYEFEFRANSNSQHIFYSEIIGVGQEAKEEQEVAARGARQVPVGEFSA